MKIFFWISLLKVIFGAGILVIDWLTINVYEDTVLGIWLGLIWGFLLAWGVCFFCCWGLQNLFKKKPKTENDVKRSYFLSLLFSFYCIFNMLLLLLGKRNKGRGVILFLIFFGLQRVVLLDHKVVQNHEQWTVF